MKACTFAVLLIFYAQFSLAAPTRFSFNHPAIGYLVLEFLADDLVHFELSAVGAAPDLNQSVYTSPYIHKNDYAGPTELHRNNHNFETAKLRITVILEQLCIEYIDKSWVDTPPVMICPKDLKMPWKGLEITNSASVNTYGLGQYFIDESVNGDWMGRVRSPGGHHGNAMTSFAGGATGNMQVPILYSIDRNFQTFALFLDNIYKQSWNFESTPWKVNMYGDQVRGYILSGPNIKALRRSYMELTGRPPLPPKKAFGLWVSEYGYDNWNELNEKWDSLRQHNFPLDGFVLDLQWFGGIKSNSTQTPMGKLTWDRDHFPDPEGMLKHLSQQGLGTILIEESYIGKDLYEYSVLDRKGLLAKDCPSCGPTYIEQNPWWGKGGMMDWSNPEAGKLWHDWKRQPLVDMGVLGHWTDLGEPEMYNSHAAYFGFPELGKSEHADVHNVYNLFWHKSIFEGYERNQEAQRPFILSRSGGAGSQRYGTALWSGDIGSNLRSLSAHLKAQMHVGLSGFDFYGSDVGGFHRGGLDGDLNEMYTRWFAVSAMIDVPVRPHTENLCNCKETSPTLIGHLESNLANIRRRYELIPYYYSVAQKSHTEGDLLVAPLFYHYPRDLNVRTLGSHKLIGANLLAALNTSYNSNSMDVYLPSGDWYDESSKTLYKSQGEWIRNFDLYPKGHYQLPLFVKSGAIIPKSHVPTDRSVNVFGQSPSPNASNFLVSDLVKDVSIDFAAGGPSLNQVRLEIYADANPSSFDYYEDDGITNAYKSGKYALTRISQTGATKESWNIKIASLAPPTFGSEAQKSFALELVSPNVTYKRALVNGVAVPFTVSRQSTTEVMHIAVHLSNNDVTVEVKLLP